MQASSFEDLLSNYPKRQRLEAVAPSKVFRLSSKNALEAKKVDLIEVEKLSSSGVSFFKKDLQKGLTIAEEE